MHKAGITDRESFAVCFGKNGGHLTMGGYDPALNDANSKVQWAKLGPANLYFNTVVFERFGVGKSREVGAARGQTVIIDSGTTHSSIPAEMFQELVMRIDSYCVDPDSDKLTCGGNKQHKFVHGYACYSFPGYTSTSNRSEFYKSFPAFTIDLKPDVKWRINPSEYLFYFYKDLFCLTFIQGAVQGYMLMGGSTMRQNNLVFDMKERQMGIFKAECSPDPYRIVGDYPEQSENGDVDEEAEANAAKKSMLMRFMGQTFSEEQVNHTTVTYSRNLMIGLGIACVFVLAIVFAVCVSRKSSGSPSLDKKESDAEAVQAPPEKSQLIADSRKEIDGGNQNSNYRTIE